MKDVINKTAIDVRILKVAQCPSVSGKSTLTYHIGCTEAGDIHLRIHANTAAGFFSQEWLSLDAIEDALTGSHFTSMALQPLFKGKSQNNAAFLLAILLQEGLVGLAEGKQRCYQTLDASGFKAEIKKLVEANVSLNADDKPVKQTKKSVTSDGGSNTGSQAKSEKVAAQEPQG